MNRPQTGAAAPPHGVRRATALRCVMLLAGLVVGAAACAEPRMSTVAGAGGVPLLVAEEGDPAAPGILFLHGFAQSHRSFDRQFRSDLAKRFHVVAVDLRGQGGSGKPWNPSDYGDPRIWADDVAAVIEATRLRKPVLVGWSFGGFVAIDYVRVHGTSRIAGINLVGSLAGLNAAPGMSAGDSARATAIRARSDRQRGLDLGENIAANRATASGYVAANMTEAERETLIATEMMMPAYARRAMRSRSLDNRDVVAKLDLPVLLTRGSTDTAMPADYTKALLGQLPSARLSLYDGVGHLPFVEQADRFNRELAAFADAVVAK